MPLIRPRMQIAVTFLPGEAVEQRVAAARLVRELEASAGVLKKYGSSLGSLLGTAGPDRLVKSLERQLGPDHGRVRLHFYPFGALTASAEWINDYAARH